MKKPYSQPACQVNEYIPETAIGTDFNFVSGNMDEVEMDF